MITKPDGSTFKKPLQLLLVKTDKLFSQAELSRFQKYGLKEKTVEIKEVDL